MSGPVCVYLNAQLLHSVHLRVAERARMPVPEMGRMDPVWLTIPVAVIAGMLGEHARRTEKP